MNRKEQWAAEIFQSIEGMHRASPPDDLFKKISHRLTENNTRRNIPLRRLKWAAAAACFLLVLNGYALSRMLSQKEQPNPSGLYDTPFLSDLNPYD